MAPPVDNYGVAGVLLYDSGRVDDRVVLALAQCGGWATRAELRGFVSSRQIDKAVTAELVHRVGRGRYTLAGYDVTRGAASELSAVISHRSAALTHGWSVRSEPKKPELIIPRNRNVPNSRRRTCHVRWRRLSADDIQDGGVTTPLRTVVDCARDLPFAEALAVADSALRAGAVDPGELAHAASGLSRGTRTLSRLALTQASVLAANPFESALRGLALEAVGPLFVPQLELDLDGVRIRPDLVSESLRIVIEADSHEFHTQRAQLVRDCWRYDELTLDGWLVLRFSWEHVMFHEEWVRSVVRRAVAAHGPTGSLTMTSTRRPVIAGLVRAS